jgi:hypothetical protein
MYNNLMNKFRYGNMKTASYLDPESGRMAVILMNTINMTAEELIKEGKVTEAKNLLNKCLEVIPNRINSLSFAIREYYLAELLYQAKETQKANALAKATADYAIDQLNYLADVAKTKSSINSNDIQLNLSILNELVNTTKANGQTSLSADLEKRFKEVQSNLSGIQ